MLSLPAADMVGHWTAILLNQEALPQPVDTLAGCAGTDGVGAGTFEVVAGRLTLGGDGTWSFTRTGRTTCWPDVAEADRVFDGTWTFEVSDSTVDFVAAQPDAIRIGPGHVGWEGEFDVPLEELDWSRYYVLTFER